LTDGICILPFSERVEIVVWAMETSSDTSIHMWWFSLLGNTRRRDHRTVIALQKNTKVVGAFFTHLFWDLVSHQQGQILPWFLIDLCLHSPAWMDKQCIQDFKKEGYLKNWDAFHGQSLQSAALAMQSTVCDEMCWICDVLITSPHWRQLPSRCGAFNFVSICERKWIICWVHSWN
jgi:hypothetical protein